MPERDWHAHPIEPFKVDADRAHYEQLQAEALEALRACDGFRRMCGWACRSRTPATRDAPAEAVATHPLVDAAWRADVLREIPAAVRFLSCEPLLGSLYTRKEHHEREASTDDSGHDPDRDVGEDAEGNRRAGWPVEGRAEAARRRALLDLTGIDWVIAGGESGPKARPSHPDWFRELRDACLAPERELLAHLDAAEGNVGGLQEPRRPAFFFKQWGEWMPYVWKVGDNSGRLNLHAFTDREPFQYVVRVDKKAAGRELDGRTWDEMPTVREVVAAT